MKLFSKFSSIKENYFSILLALFPISFIAGNMIINIIVILLIFSGLFFFYKDILKMRYHFFDKILFLYFALILLVGIYNDFLLYVNFNDFSLHRGSYTTSLNSLKFLRFLFLYLIIRILVEKNFLNFKLFFIVCALSSLFVCVDIYFQLLTGKDFFGYEIDPRFRKLGGPFGDEYIAGGYIQRFSLFSFFILPAFYLKKNKKISYSMFSVLSLIFFTGIIFSGNRIPLILFSLSLFLLLIFELKGKKNFITFALLGFFVFFLVFNLNTSVQNNFKNFYSMTQKLIINFISKDSDYSNLPYTNEFSSGYNTWLINKSFGGGVKNFNFYCYKSNEKFKTNHSCNLHPHNYYLEILTETGFVGFLIMSIIFIKVLYSSFFKKYFLNSVLNRNIIIAPFIFLFFIEIFPIKSTGSFFTTGNATYIFLILAILVGLINKDNLIENTNYKDIN